MFSVAQQSVTLRSAEDAEAMSKGDEGSGDAITLNFRTNDADTSKSLLVVTMGDQEHRLLFMRGGQLIDQQVKVVNPEDPNANPSFAVAQPFMRDPANPAVVTDRTRPRPNEGRPEDNPNHQPRTAEQQQEYVDTMRDPRADDPYLHRAPIPPEAIERGDMNQPYGSPAPALNLDDPNARTQRLYGTRPVDVASAPGTPANVVTAARMQPPVQENEQQLEERRKQEREAAEKAEADRRKAEEDRKRRQEEQERQQKEAHEKAERERREREEAAREAQRREVERAANDGRRPA